MKRNLIYHTPVSIEKQLSGLSRLKDQQVRLCSLSRDGFSVVCDQETLTALLPNNRGISPKEPVTFNCALQLPGVSREISSGCEAFAVRRLSRLEFQLSLRFVDMNEAAFEIIDHYVDTKLHGKKPGMKLKDIPTAQATDKTIAASRTRAANREYVHNAA